MLFGDEKDYIEDGADIEISEDGTVTWEDVLSGDDDDVLIPNKSTKPQSVTSSEDDLEVMPDLDDDVSDEELSRILNDGDSSDEIVDDDLEMPAKPTTSANDAQSSAGGYEIDGQLASIVMDDDNEQPAPKKTAQREYNLHEREVVREPQAKAGPSKAKQVVLVIITLIIVLSVYFYVTNSTSDTSARGKSNIEQNNNVDNDEEVLAEESGKEAQTGDIPIVNENDVNTIQPEQAAPVEKKEVVEVKPTGRNNPFMPLQKYVSRPIADTEFVLQNSSLPAPPSEYGELDERIEKMITIAVSGIMYDAQKPSAIITFDDNDYFVQKGDKLDDYKVMDITKNYVILALGKNTYKAMVGEEFKITQDFGGSALYLKDGRQYHSVGYDNDRESNKDQPKNERYVSEKDVQVRGR